jgi:GH43 family beta-xylosidase
MFSPTSPKTPFGKRLQYGMRFFRPWLCALLLATAAASAWAEDIPSPLIPLRADPYIYLHADGWYYFCATVPEYDRIELRRARTISGLRGAAPVVVWKKQGRGLVESRNIWAPELHYIDSKWYIYYAAGTSLAPYDVRIRAIECDAANPLSGPWIDRGKINTGKDTLCLDATSFEHRGSRYLVWAQRLTRADDSSMDLYIAPMKDPTTLAGKAVMIGRADQIWERRDPSNLKMEGPAVLKRNGRIFITYSSNAVDANYAVGLMEARADSRLLDPASWSKRPGPVLGSDPEAKVFGPGHNSFTTSPDGAVDYIVYHARDYERIDGPPIHDPNRATIVQAFSWDSDGRPLFARPRLDGQQGEKGR